jgi:hypothetical protein
MIMAKLLPHVIRRLAIMLETHAATTNVIKPAHALRHVQQLRKSASLLPLQACTQENHCDTEHLSYIESHSRSGGA